ncbi:uncharacterized protein V6R79_007308 [Siganus canaliculatus]
MAPVKRKLYQRLLFLLFFLPISGVLCFSELFFIKEPHDVTVMRRDAVILDCQAHGESPIDVRWLKNGVRVEENDRVYSLSNGSLYISEVESRRGDKSDEGLYQCLAQNKYGAILSQKARLTIASISSFTIQPTSLVVTQGSVARFSCKISAHPPPIITWEFNRVTLPLATERITVLPSGVLQIHDVQRADAGNYRCIATNIASRRRSTEATLTVTPAPSPQFPQRPRIIAGPQNISVSLHQNAILECMATGNPRPIISWSRADSKSIDVYNTKVLGNGNLIISDIKPQHGGVYICRATTPGTRNYTVATANITVLAPPSFVEWPESLTRPRAGTARFVCQAGGVPMPEITWLKNGKKVHSNGRIKMYNSKLVINQIIPEDDAIYQCQAENEQGSVLSMARLIVVMSEDRPSAPRNIQADTVSSSAILLAWDRPQYNSDKVIAYSVHYMKAEGLNNEEYQVVIGNDTTRYIIDDLEPARNYTFYVVAYMPMGASRMSDHVFQHTLEDVPLRAPELSLTSHSPVDIQVSWQPLPDKLSRGRISAYRLSYRTSAESTVSQIELPGEKTQYLLESLQPDTIYLLRITAATSIGWGEQSAWTSHRTPKASSARVPLAPELHLESLNCTTIVVRWQLTPRNSASVQGYKLFYHEETQAESAPVQLPTSDRTRTIGGLDPRKKYHVKLLAYNFVGDGYQADQTISTPGCVSVRDRLVPPPPPPHNVYAKTNASSAIFLHWGRPAFTSSHAVNYTVRCNPVGLQNASLVLYLQTSEQSLLVRDLEPNTKYEFAIRLHIDQLSSPWSPVVYQSTFPEAPTSPPSNVKVTLIEEDTALVSWKPPDEPSVAVTHYTVLYASRQTWIAGEWQVLQREGTITMALLENLKPGQVYLVKVSASNNMGDGPFSHTVELTVRAGSSLGHDPRLSRGSTHSTGFSDGFYHLDQKSMTGITVGVCIALICIIICAFIIVCRGKNRKFSAVKTYREGVNTSTSTAGHLGPDGQVEHADVTVPMMGQNHFIDTKGGTNLIINCLGPVQPGSERKEKWFSFSSNVKKDSKAAQNMRHGSYQPGSTVLTFEEELSVSPDQPGAMQALLWRPSDTEGSSNSEGSHETGDSGRYSHDETEMTNLSSGLSSRPSSLTAEDSGGSDCGGPVEELLEETVDVKGLSEIISSVYGTNYMFDDGRRDDIHNFLTKSLNSQRTDGSDIETLGSEAVVEYGAELLERPPEEETKTVDIQASASAGERASDSLNNTQREQTLHETLYTSQAGGDNGGKEHEHVGLLSSSDHSDIVTLGDVKEDEHVDVGEEAAASEELYLGTSCSSQYTFAAVQTAFPAATNSSSSEEEAGQSSSTSVRRRRLRKNTASFVAQPEDQDQEEEDQDQDQDQVLESGQSEEGVKEEDTGQQEQAEVGDAPPALDVQNVRRQSSSILNKCILIALVVAISMGFGHFHGTVQIQERQKTVEKMRGNELDGFRDLLQRHVRDKQVPRADLDGLDDHKVISLLTEVIETIKKENRQLNIQQTHIKAQRDDLQMLLRQRTEERTNIVSQQQRLTAENQLLKSSLEREEKSLSALQEELRILRSKIRDLEAVGAGADSLLTENQKLKAELEEEKHLIRSFHGQRDDLTAKAQTLRKKLDKERKVTDELRRELNLLRGRITGAGKDGASEELQSRLTELERRLSFEQQRSDLWERLYVETKEERAKGDTESKVKKPKAGMAGKVKETFDAVKNSTKEFVHHHKEQIKKAKEAVKENLRKFSDSVKMTFRNFKDSASTFINNARGLNGKRGETKESWQHRSHRPHHRREAFQSNHNTRKSGAKVHEDHSQSNHKSNVKRCSGVFDCAYQESMSLFNKAMEPIRVDEFHQLLRSYLQQEVDHFHHWKDLETFISSFFHNGLFIHDQMLFTDFVSGVEDYLTDMHEYHGLDDDVFEDLDDYIYRHFFGESYTKSFGPSGPSERPSTESRESRAKQQQRKQQRARFRPHSERKWSRSGRNTDRHMADVKIELGPMPFDPKY